MSIRPPSHLVAVPLSISGEVSVMIDQRGGCFHLFQPWLSFCPQLSALALAPPLAFSFQDFFYTISFDSKTGMSLSNQNQSWSTRERVARCTNNVTTCFVWLVPTSEAVAAARSAAMPTIRQRYYLRSFNGLYL